MIQLRNLSYLVALCLIISSQAWCKADIELRGTLINITCKIGSKEKHEVDFGKEVVAQLLDGKHYKEDLPLLITCNEEYSGDLNFTIRGKVSSFEETAVETNITGLGIRFIDNNSGKMLEIDKPHKYKDGEMLSLGVVPVKAPDATFTGGDFLAVAVLELEPQ